MLQNSTTDFQIKEPLNGKLWEKEWHCLVAVERTLVQKGANEDAGGRYGVGAPSRGWLSNNQHVSMHQGTMYSLQQRVRRRPSSGPAGSPSRDRSPERVTRLSSGTGGQEEGALAAATAVVQRPLVLVFLFFAVVVLLLIIIISFFVASAPSSSIESGN